MNLKKNLFLLSFIVIFSNLNFLIEAKSNIIKPDKKILPNEVVEIQLNGLMKNDFPTKDIGIIQTWEFAHPTNQKNTGPLNNFKRMLKGENYSMLLNHNAHEIKKIYLGDNLAIFEVTILDMNKNFYKFKWQVEKFQNDGPLKNCWLTTAVSNPEPLGSSI